jgi:hypothetical protein
MSRGTGDCKIAGPEYQLRLESVKEAQKIADIFHKEFDLVCRPRVRISNYHTSHLNGTADTRKGELHLRNVGANVGVLIHELAHFDKRADKAYNDSLKSGSMFARGRLYGYRRKPRNMHGPEFKFAQTEMLLYWRKHLEKTFNIKESTTSWKERNDQLKHDPITFRHGQKVWFKSKHGKIINGYVKRVNQKTISIQPEGHSGYQYWRVSPSYVNKGWFESNIEKPKKTLDKPAEIVEDTDEENRDMICGLMDSLSKYAVHNTLSMNAIVKALWVNGVKNTDENRKIAVDYIKNELKLGIR